MSPRENVKDQVAKAKKAHAHKKTGFIRKHGVFQCLMEAEI